MEGYVIRCVDLHGNGSLYYRGNHNTFHKKKDTFTINETFTLSGAKRSVANLRKNSNEEYCIERLSSFYYTIPHPKKNNLDEKIEHALHRLDELFDGKDKGNKMRINEVRSVLYAVREQMIKR